MPEVVITAFLCVEVPPGCRPSTVSHILADMPADMSNRTDRCLTIRRNALQVSARNVFAESKSFLKKSGSVSRCLLQPSDTGTAKRGNVGASPRAFPGKTWGSMQRMPAALSELMRGVHGR
jgi:hypothetical protein